MSSPRGASTTEFAISLLAIVPVIIYSIYVGELFTVGAKAQEIEIAAAYDMSGYRYHDYTTGGTGAAAAAAVKSNVNARYAQVASAVSARVSTELADFNSYGATGRTGVALVSGRADFVGAPVTCTPRRLGHTAAGGGGAGGYFGTLAGELVPFQTFEFGPDGKFALSGPLADLGRATLNNDWMVTCRARVLHQPLWVPKTWAQEFTHSNSAAVGLNSSRLVAGLTFGGLGGNLTGMKTQSAPSLGMPVVVDDWAVETRTGNAPQEVATRPGESANPTYYRAAERIYEMHGPYWAEENLREDTQWLLGEQTIEGKQGLAPSYVGKVDRLKLGLSRGFNAPRNFTGVGNRDWYQLPHRDGEQGLPDLEAVAARRSSGSYLGHPNPSFNKP